jgi:antitoxin component of RelBE/YafQ-DinJ toxin-antitoxin module
MARDEKVIIRLTEEVKTKFQNIAERYGLTISALGSYVIGEYVARIERNEEMQEKIFETMLKDMEGMVAQDAEKSLEVAGVFEMLAGMVKQKVETQNRP